MDDSVWDHSVFSRNCERRNDNDMAQALFAEVVGLAERAGLMSDEHFSVNGTLLRAWASHKSFKLTCPRQPYQSIAVPSRMIA